MADEDILSFDKFILDVSGATLFRGEKQLALRPQAFAVLVHLAKRDGQVVTTRELIETFWDPKRATDNSLAQCIGDIREALEDEQHRIVRTVPRKGYVLAPKVSVGPAKKPFTTAGVDHTPSVVPKQGPIPTSSPAIWSPVQSTPHGFDVRALPGAPHRRAALVIILLALLAGAAWALRYAGSYEAGSAPMTMLATPTVTILPFTSPNASPEEARIAHDFMGELGAALLRSPRGFDLVLKSAAGLNGRDLAFAEAGRRLGVRYVATGTWRTAGGMSRLVVQLIEAQSGRQIWSEPFASESGNDEARSLLTIRIARSIAVQIRSTENGRPLPARPEAGHYVLQGRALLESERGEDVTRRAKSLFDRAVALDPNNVNARLGHARTRVATVANGWAPPEERPALLAEAEASVEHALAIDQRNVGGHLLRGVMARLKGQTDRAIASLEFARDINPTYVFIHGELGRTKIEAGRSEETAAHIERALALSPTDPVAAFWFHWAGIAAAHIGDFPAAANWMLKSQQVNPVYKRQLPWLAIAYAQMGEADKAKAALAEFMKDAPGFSIERWQKALRTNNATVAKQRARLDDILRSLGVPERSN